MSQSRKGATETAASNADSNSARRKEGGTSGASQPGNSTTLTGTGAAAIGGSTMATSSNIPMAEPTVDINRNERLFPPAADQSSTVRKSRAADKQPNHKRGGTTESRLDYACEQLGINKANKDSVQAIDFCLDDIYRMDWLVNFPNIRELHIVNQSISEIEGLDKSRFIERMWLNANEIETIRQIDRLPMLRQLYLGSNKIKRIRSLDKCIYLEKLWLDENRIEQIDGITNLYQLTELNLAKNNIETIGIGLDGLQALRDFNISANRIGNFKEVLNLNRLPNLTICTFSDPHYGENPICSLCNYQTYVLFHLPRLVRLDTMIVSEESKTFADTTFMKKRMYYNMRIKTIQRNTSNIMKLLKICRKVRICKIELSQSKLMKKLLEITRELEERQYISQNNKDEFESVFTYGPEQVSRNPLDQIDNDQLVNEIENKKALLTGRMSDKNEDLKDLDSIYETLKKKIYEMSEQNIHRLMTELETGGNIRFEEGRPQDRWFSSCVDLVRSRFSAEQMKHFGIIGINVTRVTRIHNRFLRNRFEEKLEQLVDLSDNQYKRSLEYLFYGVNPQAPKEIHRAMEEGFRSIQEYTEAGLPGCISLVNSVASAEIARINAFFSDSDGFSHIRAAQKAHKNPEIRGNTDMTFERGLVQIPSGQLLVCKIFLQKCTQDPNCPHFDPNQSPSQIWKSAPVDERRHTGVQSVYRAKEGDPKQRMWFVLDHALALPEYLVEFDYITDPKSVAENRRLAEASVINEECNNLFRGITETQQVLGNTSIWLAKDNNRPQNVHLTAQDLDRSDMGCLKRPLHNFMITCHIRELMESNFEFNEDSGAAAVENSMPPEIPMRSQLDTISDDLIRRISRENEIGRIVYLNLFNNKIKKIACMTSLPNLLTLIISFNEIEDIEGLDQNVKLRTLDLSHNFIRTIKNMTKLEELVNLDLRHNWIEDLNQLDHVVKHCTNLEQLGFKSNPTSTKSSYRPSIFKKIPGLQKLDQLPISEKDRIIVDQGTIDMSSAMIHEYLKNQKKNYHITSEAQQNAENEATAAGIVLDQQNSWERQVEEICLNHKKISKIGYLESFVNLRKLKLLDNNIQEIEGLESLRVLEELSLEKNKLTGIQNLDNLKYLKKLDLGSNKIKRISNVHSLASLTQLSLENNEISRLDGLEDLQCLMELYLGNNLISDMKETIKLKDLQRLIILDISGNLMNTTFGNNYRIYCIFHLRKLRVLDGLSIDNQEHQEAKETFSGRLTEEILATRLQGRFMKDVKELDLSSCKLRDFEDMFDQAQCPHLRELNLSHNQLGSLRCFGNLPMLKILKLRENRIETLFVKPGMEDRNFKRGLYGMPNLEFLDVSSNQLQYLYGLQYSPLKDLKIFHASNNEIVKIEHLEKLRQLRELDLSKNRIRQIDINSFHQHHQIMILKLNENGLRSLANIEKLEKLQTLYISNNRIQELFEIEKLAELPNLLDLSLIHNPIARKQNYRMIVIKRLIQLMVFDGKEITMEERKRIEGATGMMDTKQGQQPLVHFQQYPTVKVPVKLNPVNFDGVFNNMKFQMEQSNQQQQMPSMQQLKGQFQQNGQDMQNLIQVQSLNMQQQQQLGMPMMGNQGNPNLGVLIDNRYNGNQMPSQQEYNYQNDVKGQKVQRRPSTNKVSHDQNNNQRMMQGQVQNSQISVSAASIAQQNQYQQFQHQMQMKQGMGGPVSQGRGANARNSNQKQQFTANQVAQPQVGYPQAQGPNHRQGTIQQIISSQQQSQQLLQQRFQPRR